MPATYRLNYMALVNLLMSWFKDMMFKTAASPPYCNMEAKFYRHFTAAVAGALTE